MFYLALGWLAIRAADGLGAAAILAAGNIPRVAMLLFGGVLADRLGLARVARVTLIMRIVLMVSFALVAVQARPVGWQLAVVAGLFGLVDGVHMPAVSALSGVLFRDQQIVRVQGAMGGIGGAVEIAAAPLAGIMLAWRQDAVGWLGASLSLIALVLLPSGQAREPSVPTGSVIHEVWSVLRLALGDRLMRSMLAVFAMANLTATPAILAGIPLLAKENGWSAPEYGAILTGYAVGSVIGGAALAKWAHLFTHPARWALGSMLPGSLGILVLGTAGHIEIAVAAAALIGGTFTFGAATLVGQLKVVTPPGAMGRMMALVQVAVYSLIPVGVLVLGALTEASSAQTAEVVMAGVFAGTAITALSVGPLRRLTAAREPVGQV